MKASSEALCYKPIFHQILNLLPSCPAQSSISFILLGARILCHPPTRQDTAEIIYINKWYLHFQGLRKSNQSGVLAAVPVIGAGGKAADWLGLTPALIIYPGFSGERIKVKNLTPL